mmetsp:Transcript_128313/g.323899  ORF Transcript_128313/g.323899 Transcript_128313/m.323899 type:complete len:289 (+) Transcript_128313:681-1547(+)
MEAQLPQPGDELGLADLFDVDPVQGPEGFGGAAHLSDERLEMRKDDGAPRVQFVQSQRPSVVFAEAHPNQLDLAAESQLRASATEGRFLDDHQVVRTQSHSPSADVGAIRALQVLLELVQGRLRRRLISLGLPWHLHERPGLGILLSPAPPDLSVEPLELSHRQVPVAFDIQGLEQKLRFLCASIPPELREVPLEVVFTQHPLRGDADARALEAGELRVHVLGSREYTGCELSEAAPKVCLVLAELLERQLPRLVVVEQSESALDVAQEAHATQSVAELHLRRAQLQV